MRKTLRLFAALLAVGAISASVLVTSALAGTTPTPANLTIPLNNDRAEPGVDCPATGTYWHFVISPNNGDSYFIEFHLNLGDATKYNTSIFVPNGSQLDNVFVAVPSGKTLTSLITSGSTAEIHWNGETPTPAKFQLSHTCAGGIPPADDPTVSKDAEGAYDETFVWTPDKKADVDTVYSAGGGESGEVKYTVSVSHDDGTVSNVELSGTIKVTNPNEGAIELDSVTDQLSDATIICTVDDSAGLTIPANGSKDYPYDCELDGLPSGDLTNKATITWLDQTLSDDSELDAGTAKVTTGTISFTPNEIDECTTVDDTNPDGPQDVVVCVGDDNPTEFPEYSDMFEDPAGVCTEHKNTWTSTTNDTGTEDSAGTTVEDCQGADLIVTKDATPSFTRAYDWDITKDVDQNAPGSTTFDYTVSVSHDAGTDSEWKVIGTIKVENPNAWQDVTLDSLTDAIDNGGTCTVDTSAGLTIPMGDSVEYPYECTYASAPDSTDFTNTVTATWNAANYHTPSGSDDGTAEESFGDPTTVIDECIDVVDDNGTPANTADDKSLGQVCVGAVNPTGFEYSKTLDVTDAKCVTYTNTASYTTTDDANDTDETDSASQTVEYCRPATIGYWKNHMYQCAPRERSTNGCSNNGPFTADFLPQSLGNYSVNTTALALAVFNANNCSNAASSDNNASACLAAQLLGAKLNVDFGSPSCIAATIAAADNFLINNVLKNNVPGYLGPTGGPYSVNTRAQAIAYKTTLDNYNKGLGCPV